jgi:hypothetical protein
VRGRSSLKLKLKANKYITEITENIIGQRIPNFWTLAKIQIPE